ncbi:MAG TPA: methyltransferase domain-containing protein [Candidatus Latescibacteria bacterium]|nr:methyltransferase domain-containing protein [Candidatus Latescibacterota bacterium]
MKGEAFLRMCAAKPPFSRMHPKLMGFFKAYLSHEKVIPFRGRYVLNTHFPPYPGPAFDTMVRNFEELGEAGTRRLFSVTLAVTNRCPYRCWHCYNAGRSQKDVPLSIWKPVIARLQELGAANVTISGGEPLLREDLEEFVASFDERTSLTLNTTGRGLTPERAGSLRDAGLFAVGVSVDSSVAQQHDRMRGYPGAFGIALDAIKVASDCGLYPYIISVATREFLEPDHFHAFMTFARETGALEVHLLEPSATGTLAGNRSVTLTDAERRRILQYQREVAEDEDLPILSTFTYLESPDAFGCGAGLTHLYIDGSGEVCPCNLVPLSFGTITREPLDAILERIGQHFKTPRTGCVGRTLCRHIDNAELPLAPDASSEICRKHLPRRHGVPRFFRVRNEARGEVDQEELRDAYDGIHQYYDEFWVKEAGKPVESLIAALSLSGNERVFEAGCGTGFATVLLAAQLRDVGHLVAVDLSEGMLTEARARARAQGFGRIDFRRGDALQELLTSRPFDLVFSSWVLGYIPLKPFFEAAAHSLKKGGRLAFIVHRENSPYEPLQIFGEIVVEDPEVLTKRIAFDFPADTAQVSRQLAATGLEPVHLDEGEIVFRYRTAREALEHLKKSGAGTAYYEAVDPAKRDQLEALFIEKLTERRRGKPGYDVVHNYITCIARKA